MPRDWKSSYSRRLQVRASERGRKMARARWVKDRERRAKLAEADPVNLNPAVRLVVIVREQAVREWTVLQCDSQREIQRAWRAARRWQQQRAMEVTA